MILRARSTIRAGVDAHSYRREKAARRGFRYETRHDQTAAPAGLLLAGTALAAFRGGRPDALHANDQQRQTSLIITQVMEKFHYRKPTLDDAMSSAIFDRYLDTLDANRSFFCAEDIAQFERYRAAG